MFIFIFGGGGAGGSGVAGSVGVAVARKSGHWTLETTHTPVTFQVNTVPPKNMELPQQPYTPPTERGYSPCTGSLPPVPIRNPSPTLKICKSACLG